MAFVCTYNGIVFSEGKLDNSRVLGNAECDLSFKFGAQLKTLRDVKDVLAAKARAVGGNAIADFTYGQKSRWLAIDDVAFWGKGVIVLLPEAEYQYLMQTK